MATRWAYDGLGRMVRELRPDGTTTTSIEKRVKEGGAWRLRRTTSESGGESETVEFDGLGRAVRRWWQGPEPPCSGLCLSAGPLVQRVEFDALGEYVARRSLSAREASKPGEVLYHEYVYDGMGRPKKHVLPWGDKTTYVYGDDGHGCDAVGNQVTRLGLKVTYSAFDLPKSFERTATGESIAIDYDGDQQRGRKSTALEETVYVGDPFGSWQQRKPMS